MADTNDPDVILYADPFVNVQRLEMRDPITGVQLAVVEIRLTWPNADPRKPHVVIPLTAATARKVATALVECSLGAPEDN